MTTEWTHGTQRHMLPAEEVTDGDLNVGNEADVRAAASDDDDDGGSSNVRAKSKLTGAPT